MSRRLSSSRTDIDAFLEHHWDSHPGNEELESVDHEAATADAEIVANRQRLEESREQLAQTEKLGLTLVGYGRVTD